jgi:hypothetical protein
MPSSLALKKKIPIVLSGIRKLFVPLPRNGIQSFFLKDNEYDKKYYYLLPAVIAECGGTGTGNYRQCNYRQRKYNEDKAEADGAA